MIAITAVWLFIIGLFNSYKLSVKFDKIVCGATLFAAFGLLFWFTGEMVGIKEHIFSFVWNSSPSGDIKVDIVSNSYNCELFLPFLIITTLAIGGNFCFRYEEKRCKYNMILLFNLATLLMMITSNNFVQLLAAVFLIDIFAVVSAKNINACKKFITMNLLADMIIFMLLALINGRIDSLDIRQVINYKNMGYHLDFITIFGFTSILMKMGFFFFQPSLLSLKDLRYHRLQNILCLFSPISALILLLKFNPLWSSSEYFLPYLDAACVLTMVWSALRAACVDNFKKKSVHWQIMFFALLLEILRFHGFVWDWNISKLVLAEYLLLCGLHLLYYNSGRKNSVLQMMNQKYQSKKGIFISLLCISPVIFAQIENLEMIYNNRNRYYIWTYAVLFLLSFCGVLHQICFSRAEKNLTAVEVKSRSQKPLLIFMMMAVCMLLFSRFDRFGPAFWGMSAAFVILSISGLSSFTRVFYRNDLLQKTDLFSHSYTYIFENFLQEGGRLLWLVIDWKFVEKFTTGVVLACWQTGLRFFRNVQGSLFWRFVFILIVFVAAIICTPYFKEMK